MEALPNITVLISGSGTNLQALIDACANGTIKARISLVISSSDNAYGLQRAEKAKIATKVHSLKSYYAQVDKEDKAGRAKARETFNLDLLNVILYGDKYASQESVAATPFSSGHKSPDLIVCAGWMLILSKDFLNSLEPYNIPIINLHPALPGQFNGINAIERSWKAGQNGEIDKAGIMIHKVIPEVDEGDPLLVKEIPVIKGESLEDYEHRIHENEHQGIVEGVIKALQVLVKR